MSMSPAESPPGPRLRRRLAGGAGGPGPGPLLAGARSPRRPGHTGKFEQRHSGSQATARAWPSGHDDSHGHSGLRLFRVRRCYESLGATQSDRHLAWATGSRSDRDAGSAWRAASHCGAPGRPAGVLPACSPSPSP